MKGRILTIDMVKEKYPCIDTFEEFMALCQDGAVLITKEWAREHARLCCWHWAANNLLSKEGRKIFLEVVAKLDGLLPIIEGIAYVELLAEAWAEIFIEEGE